MLTQQEADALLVLEKYDFSNDEYKFPYLGGSLRLSLQSMDKKETFNLDVTRGYIALEKITFQTRARKAVVLVRLDIDGPPHRNPDGEEIGCPHIHLYREGYGDKWAYPLPDELKCVLDNPYNLLDKFMDYCHIIGKPIIQRELFI
jgi:possible lj965 prophage protein